MDKYEALTGKLALGLAAPHTWVCSILPVLLGSVLYVVEANNLNAGMFYCLLAIAVLMQSATNVLDDYHDFVKQTDTAENSLDSNDAILVYHALNLKSVLKLAAGFLISAIGLGIYVIYRAGWIPLGIGLLGGVIVVGYSTGKIPICYLPIGELVSGLVMGGLITLAVYVSLGGEFLLGVLYYAMPLMTGIGLIVFSNNICDIDRDTKANRNTLPILLGGRQAVRCHRLCMIFWIMLIGFLTAREFSGGLFLFVLMIIAGWLPFNRLMSFSFNVVTRYQIMADITTLNWRYGLCYISMILLHGYRG